jgi:hypothetical protein
VARFARLHFAAAVLTSPKGLTKKPIPQKAFYPRTFKILVLSLLTAVVVLQVCTLARPHRATTMPGYRTQLAALVWKLRDNGMEFKVYSQRPDGLWDDGVYLTTTDKTFREIASLRVNPAMLDQWQGPWRSCA